MASRNKLFPQLTNQNGAILLMVLVSITLLGLMAGIAGSSWKTIVQQAKEVDLLWKGNQIRRAIGSYYNTSLSQSSAPKVFPSELKHLTQDPRSLEVMRHLRRLYVDPMTGEDWETIKGPSGQIIGVRSKSNKVPFKQNNFLQENKSFAGQQSYHGWLFIYQPEKKTTAESSLPANNQLENTPD